MTPTYKQFYEVERTKFENYLKTRLDELKDIPEPILSGMKYAVGSGGKRLRPMLAILVCKLFGIEVEKVYPIAVSVELIHNYSLVHDDLPCMDDDELRRGMPTVHVKALSSLMISILSSTSHRLAHASPTRSSRHALSS